MTNSGNRVNQTLGSVLSPLRVRILGASISSLSVAGARRILGFNVIGHPSIVVGYYNIASASLYRGRPRRTCQMGTLKTEGLDVITEGGNTGVIRLSASSMFSKRDGGPCARFSSAGPLAICKTSGETNRGCIGRFARGRFVVHDG